MDERIAVLETKVTTLEAQNSSILTKLDGISAQLSRQKGFIGGMLFVISCVASLITIVVEYMRH